LTSADLENIENTKGRPLSINKDIKDFLNKKYALEEHQEPTPTSLDQRREPGVLRSIRLKVYLKISQFWAK
jgi:hypothetical protein